VAGFSAGKVTALRNASNSSNMDLSLFLICFSLSQVVCSYVELVPEKSSLSSSSASGK
jgi:hypothetical protein